MFRDSLAHEPCTPPAKSVLQQNRCQRRQSMTGPPHTALLVQVGVFPEVGRWHILAIWTVGVPA
jgi:hypothetical protein